MYRTITLDVALQEEWKMYLTYNIRCCITGRMVNVPKMYLTITLNVALLKKW